MSRITTTITDHAGRVTTVVTRRSGCGGCVYLIALVVVVFGPIAWFPGPLAVLAYTFTAGLLVAGAVRWYSRRSHGQPVPLPPAVPTPPAHP